VQDALVILGEDDEPKV